MIQILDSQTVNCIAAGEVVERPASVIKELLENSLDAGANAIQVEIEQGGIKLLRVRDNGCGMTMADAKLAFLSHATSKISKLSDLDSLQSLGFRGEALASIAAVARVRLHTRALGASEGCEIMFEGGTKTKQGSCGCAEGCLLEVRDLFYNTPARYKFLKRDSTEAAYVEDVILRLAFTRPDVSFALKKDGKDILLTPGNNDVNSVIYSLWGKDSAKNNHFTIYTDEHAQIELYLAKAALARKNRSRQVVVVNNRVVQSALIRKAIDQASQGFFVKGLYPELLMYITMQPQLLDVNVHPQKTEVRFAAESAVFSAVYHSIRANLNEQLGSNTNLGQFESTQPLAEDSEQNRAYVQPELPLQVVQEANSAVFAKLSEGESTAASSVRWADTEQAQVFAYLNSQQDQLKQAAKAGLAEQTSEKTAASEAGLAQLLANARLIGQVFATYILLEAGESLLMIDQHAAHERILYEKLLANSVATASTTVYSQELLFPLSLQCSLAEIDAVERERNCISALGFDFDQLSDNTLVLRAVPQTLASGNYDAASAFRYLIDKALSNELEQNTDRDELYHNLACKAAVKAHDRLSYDEMTSLLAQLQNLDNPFNCPHGRPVIKKITKYEMAKMFLRVVN